MNILVTGACGFIGSNLVPKLLKAGHKVIGFDNLVNSGPDAPERMKREAGKAWANFSFFKIDIKDLDPMYAVCVRFNVDHVVHLAALGSVPRSFLRPLDYIDVNEKGFANVAWMAAHLGCRRMVYASSSSVYGDVETLKRTEGVEGDQLSPYAVSKMQNEMFARVWARQTGLEMTGLRFFNVYGPGQRADSNYSAVIPKFITEAKPTVNGDGTVSRDFTYVDDVCEAIWAALSSTKSPVNHSSVFNVGTGKAHSLNNLLDLLGITNAEYRDPRPGDVAFSVADTALAKLVLGFEAKTPIIEGLKRTVAYYREALHGKPEAESPLSEG